MGTKRITEKYWRSLDPWEFCGLDDDCRRICGEEGGCRNGCIVPKMYTRLAAYEDTGLEPEEIADFQENYRIATSQFADYKAAEVTGRLVVLPCKVGDTIYVLGESRIVECNIDKAYLGKENTLEYQVSFDCGYDCDGCPFSDWQQDHIGECECSGEYGGASIEKSNFGKTVFLTREEAEAALAGRV